MKNVLTSERDFFNQITTLTYDIKAVNGKRVETGKFSSGMGDFVREYPNKIFFEFVNEEKFLGTKGGHSHTNIDEFLTSYMHSLMYLAKFLENTARYNPEDKQIIIKLYIETLQKLIEESKNMYINNFYKQKLEELNDMLK